MQASIADILESPAQFADKIVYIDGVLLVTAFDRASSRFEQVWLAQAARDRRLGLRGLPIRSDSTLWHGLSRLSPRHEPGYPGYRVHDAARACVQVSADAGSERAPRISLLTAAVFRSDFTLYVGESGVRLEQALPRKAAVSAVADIRRARHRYLRRECLVYGTLVIHATPAAQVLLPGKIPIFAAGQPIRAALTRSHDPEDEAHWLEDIAYPQSDSRRSPLEAARDAIQIDPYYPIARRLAAFPGVNQTIVRPAIIQGTLVASGSDDHFAALTALRNLYLQNIRFDGDSKSFESVVKLKGFAKGAG